MQVHNYEKKICIQCGTVYIPRGGNQKICDRCSSGECSVQFHERKKKNVSRLDMRIREADSRGMSYGKYVSLLYDQALKQRGKKK